MRYLEFILAAFVARSAASPVCTEMATWTGVTEAESWFVASSNKSFVGSLEICDVQVYVGNRINVWMKLPVNNWNERYVQYGCGGGCGYNPFDLAIYNYTDAIVQGYAVGTNDQGNPPSSGASSGWTYFANNFQRRIDWGYLATHLNLAVSQDILDKFYSSATKYTYHIGGSTGGRQSLVQAQRYPEDFDGIYSSAPALNETGITAFSIAYSSRAVLLDKNFTQAITLAEIQTLHDSVLAQCDELDGVADGVVGLPRSCFPDVDKLLCSENQTIQCLSSSAVQSAKSLYTGPVNQAAGAKLNLEGFLPGSELAWGEYYLNDAPSPSLFFEFATTFLSGYAFWPDPVGGMTPFDIDFSDPTLIQRTSKTESLEYGGSADVGKFRQLGNKLVMAQGLADVAVPPSFARDVYERTVDLMGYEEVMSFFRFFEIPGGYHVTGGPGANVFNELDVISAWVERGEAPDMIEVSHAATNGTAGFTRPIYPYPFLAKYSGSGDPNDASSFVPFNATSPYWDLK